MKFKVTYFFILAAQLAFAQMNERENPSVVDHNKLAPYATFFMYDNEQQAIDGNETTSNLYKSLNGEWKCNIVENAKMRPLDFANVN